MGVHINLSPIFAPTNSNSLSHNREGDSVPLELSAICFVLANKTLETFAVFGEGSELAGALCSKNKPLNTIHLPILYSSPIKMFIINLELQA